MAETKSTKPQSGDATANGGVKQGAQRRKASGHTGARATPLRTRAPGLFGSATAAQPFIAVASPKAVDYPLLERDVQAWWDEHAILSKYLLKNAGAEERWSFIDGPMTANNPMGVHHAWGRTYKDLWQRFNTMRGYRQRYQNGWDCQGLHVETEVEKELGFKSKHDIEDYGIARFVEACKARVRRFADIARAQSIRLAEWMDWTDSYYTMSDENNYTIWGFLKRSWEHGWIYKGHDVMPWCPRCGTGISDMEINEGRKQVQHTSVYVRFPLLDRPGEYLLIWTTTPWTLPANVAVAVSPDLTYAAVEQDGEIYYLSESVVNEDLAKLRGHEHGDFRVAGTLLGSDMLGWRYTGPFDELPAWQSAGAEHRVIAWDEVGAEEGTGLVHIAPGCGREDFALARDEALAVLAPVDENGVYLAGYDWLTGLSVGDVARPIFEDLRRKGVFYQTRSIEHVYPHCWRCKTELIFRLVDEWFISMEELRPRLMAIVDGVRWIPGFGLDREQDWLRNMEDWMISKKRYWGLALPIYECSQCGHFEVIGDKDELKARAAEGWDEFEGHTPHRPWVDAVKIQCANCGAVVSRIADVGNPWLDAGIVPFSTLQYRTNRAYWREWYPADFITESFPGQFRNWFYSLLVMAAVLEDSAPFKTVLGYATVLDESGDSMHKSKGNSIGFDDAAAVVGADTMRWLYVSHTPEQDLRFPRIPSDAEAEALRAAGQPPRLSDLWMQARTALDKLWDVYRFFVTYANIDGFKPTQHSAPTSERSDVDRWMLAELQVLVGTVTESLERYEAHHAAMAITEFVLNLSNWYVRRSRRQFWKAEEDAGKVGAYLTLYECLVTVTRLLAPFTPFYAEAVYQNLVRRVDEGAAESVHLSGWPVADAALLDERLRQETALVLRMVNLGRAAREKAQIRVRQPLGTLYASVMTADERDALNRLGDQVLDELNVKRLELMPHDSDKLVYALRPRPQVLGPKYGKMLPQILAAVRELDARDGAVALQERGALPVEANGERLVLSPEEVEVVASARAGYVAAEDHGYVALLETALTPELLAEGLVRDLTHTLQEVRKRAGLEIEDPIRTWITTDAELAAVVRAHEVYLRDETLSRELHIAGPSDSPATVPPTNAFHELVPGAKMGGHDVSIVIVQA